MNRKTTAEQEILWDAAEKVEACSCDSEDPCLECQRVMRDALLTVANMIRNR